MNWISAKNKGFSEDTTRYYNKDLNLDLILSIDVSTAANEEYPIYTINFRTADKENNRYWYYKDEFERDVVINKIFDSYIKIKEI